MIVFIHQETGKSLEEFHERIFSIFGLKEFEERDSANYPPYERYYIAYGKSKSLKLWDDDSSHLENYLFMLTVNDNTYEFGEGELPESAEDIAIQLSANGIKCFVPMGEHWKLDWNKEGKFFNPT